MKKGSRSLPRNPFDVLNDTATTYGLKKQMRTGASVTRIAVFNPGGQNLI